MDRIGWMDGWEICPVTNNLNELGQISRWGRGKLPEMEMGRRESSSSSSSSFYIGYLIVPYHI
jgi:hypothetical protein